jgi:hypothetical protein
MRTSALVLLLACCGPATPPIAAPQVEPVAPDGEVATAAKQDAGTAAPPQPPDVPAGEPVLNKLTVPGERAPNLAIGKTEQAAIDAACKKVCQGPSCACDAIRPMPHYMLLRRFTLTPSRHYEWYVLQRKNDRWFTVEDLEFAPGGEDISRPRQVCGARGPDPLPEGLGVIGVRLPDLDLDGRPDLLFECRFGGWHTVHYCLFERVQCASIAMRGTRDEELILDADLEFRDGWFIRTVRIDTWGEARGNVKVDGVRTPDPAPGR